MLSRKAHQQHLTSSLAMRAAAGTDTQRLLVIKIKRSDPEPLRVLVTDRRGNISYTTAATAELLGTSVKQLMRSDLSKLLPQPFSLLHHKWIKVGDSWGAAGNSMAGAQCLYCCAHQPSFDNVPRSKHDESSSCLPPHLLMR